MPYTLAMVFDISGRALALRDQVARFMEEKVYPLEAEAEAHLASERTRWQPFPFLEPLKAEAKAAGLFNLFLPDPVAGAGLGNLEYAPICEVMGRSPLGPEVFNCSAPDTGNMEVLHRYGSEEQKARWLGPLLAGEIRSCFAMTEPEVASSDATNITASMVPDGDDYVLDGKKWWTSGAMDPRCRVAIFMGKSNPDAPVHRQQSMILVPMDSPGVRIVRPLTVFGFDDAPHGHAEVWFEQVRVPKENLLLGEGRGFEIAQGRLGPGRIHHCMRSIGAAERALELMRARAQGRVAFGRPLAAMDTVRELIARSRIDIDQARLLTLHAAHKMDVAGNKAARTEIAMIKVVAPNAALSVLDRAMQVFGGAGVCADFPLAQAWAAQRALRIADGPDAVHLEAIAKLELKKPLPPEIDARPR